MDTPDPNAPTAPNEPNPYAPPRAKIGEDEIVVGSVSVLGPVAWASLKVLAVGLSAFIAFAVTCGVTLSLPVNQRRGEFVSPWIMLSPVVGVAVLIGMSYYLFFGKPRSARKR